ncbi:hypothetical protein [Wolbachia endosymbiont of Chironomus riparius]|uniref:hypothetical protein n=1 Tax=Wolbachia endosymbiont of Chironomus riparius TaxID=2883238 RepID=UPI00209CA0E7|nr:hypothetical protein [Wolbachia endosymbiont of Chironomus riparius]
MISDSKDRLSDEEYIDNIIPDKVRLLGASDNSYSQSLEKEPLITELHNDLIVIKRPTIIINMLNGFKTQAKKRRKNH